MARMEDHVVLTGDCTELLRQGKVTRGENIHLTFLDPPFNQGKDYYGFFNDKLPDSEYWQIMEGVCKLVYETTAPGGVIYFMQREKHAEMVLCCLRKAGWVFQNLIIWKKLTSAVPNKNRYGKHYQIIVFATKGDRPRVFNKLRIDPPLPANYKQKRPTGMFVTDLWDDVRELTSGYFAGEEPFRTEEGTRVHKQQSPNRLLLRMILSSTLPGDLVLDPFSGTGTTALVAKQTGRCSVSVEVNPDHAELIRGRIASIREADNITALREEYAFTEELDAIWPPFSDDH